MKNFVFTALFCALFSAQSAVGAGVSFQQARLMMQQRADMLKISQAEIDQKTQQTKEARSLSGPF